MGSGNTKGRRREVNTVQDERKEGTQSHKNGALPVINITVPTPSRDEVEPKTTQESTENKATADAVVAPKYDDATLIEYVQENPELGALLNGSFEAVKGLKDCLESDCLLPTEFSKGVDEYGLILTRLYFKWKDIKSRSKLCSFMVQLGLPKLVRVIFVTLRTRFPEASTWDRKPKDEETKEAENNDKEEKETGNNNREESKERENNSKEEKETGNINKKEKETGNNNREESKERENNSKEENETGNINKKEKGTGNNNRVEEKDQMGLTQQQDDSEDDKTDLKAAQDCLSGGISGAMLNFTDLNEDFCIACGEEGLISFLVEMSNDARTCLPALVKYVNPETQRLKKNSKRGKMLSKFLGILHNLSRHTPCRIHFINCNAVEVIVPLLKAEVTLYATKALLILAYLIDEKNNEMIMSDKEPIMFLVRSLEKSLKAANRRYLGFSSFELAEGLGQIASNDVNKKLIGSNGAIPILVTMIQKAKTEEEKTVAAETLWTLTFDEENKKAIKEDEEAMTVLNELKQSESSETRKAAAGVLWELEGKERHSGQEPQAVVSDSSQHIMISYQWDVQNIVIQIRNKLQTIGFKVWIDVDEMGGSTLESMAKAVEDAAVVLMCVSQKYKDSPNCRSEAEYTFQLRRDVIPLMMERNYTPDGWLGMIVGAKLWIDFCGKHKVTSGLEKLVKELKDRGRQVQEELVQVTSVDVLDARPDRPDIRKWTPEDVAKWLADSGLEKFNSEAKFRLDGPLLIRLHNLRNESPEFFYSSILRDFRLSNVFEVLQFTDALDQLVD